MRKIISSEMMMLFEYRRYTVKPGRMDELHSLMRDYVIPVLKDQGTQEIGYWTGDSDGNIVFDYILAFSDETQRKGAWKAVADDIDYQSFKGRLGDNPPWNEIASTRLVPTSYSPLK